MFAARLRASLKPLLHGRQSFSSLTRNRKIATNSKSILHERFSNGDMISLCLSGNGVGINWSFHNSSRYCSSTNSDVEVETQGPELVTFLEDDFLAELGSIEIKENSRVTVLESLSEKAEFEIPEAEDKKNKNKKKKKHGEASDVKLKLLTEKPDVFWKTNGKRKMEAHGSTPASNGTDSNVLSSKPSKSLSPSADHKSKSQNIVSPSSEEKNQTGSTGSSNPTKSGTYLNVSASKPSKSSSPSGNHKSKAQNVVSPSSEAKNKTNSKESSTSNTLPNHPSSVVVIRISNLSSKTADSMIHSMCLSLCPLEGLSRVNEDTVDVFFRARNLKEAESILKWLNDATVDHSQWKAEIIQEAEETPIDEMGTRIISGLEDLEKQLSMRRILAKDLEILLHSVVHLENHPLARSGGKA